MEISHKARKHYKYSDLLTAIMVISSLTAVVLTYREVAIGPFILPGGVFSIAVTFACADIFAEIYGYSHCKKIIWTIIVCEVIASLAIYVVLHLPTPPNWHKEAYFDLVLGSTFRVVLANTTASLIGYFANAYLISKWKILTAGRFYWIRSVFSSAIGEAMYNSAWASIAFVGINSTSGIVKIAFSMWLYKIVFTIIANIFGAYIVKQLKRHEQVDVFDYDTKFNPFKLEVIYAEDE